MADLILKQVVSVIDKRTTMTCLRVAGQVRRVTEPFDTLAGPKMYPPFHGGCRSHVIPWLGGFVSEQRVLANAEIQLRPAAERRFGPDGYEGRVPPLPAAIATPEPTAEAAQALLAAASVEAPRKTTRRRKKPSSG